MDTNTNADVIDYQLHGDDMQLVDIQLDPGEGVRAEAGAMVYMSEDVEMQTSAEGGLFSGFKRMLTGEDFFITSFAYNGSDRGHVGFAAPYPGKIVALDLGDAGGAFLCQKDAFLCAAQGVEIETAFTKRIGAGLFGGEGFVLQRLEGDGYAFVHVGGSIIKRELAAGETLRVDTGCVAAFSPSIDYDVQWVGGFTNALFGGEGLLLTQMTGPGTAYLQSLPFSRLVDRIVSASGLKRRGEGSPNDES